MASWACATGCSPRKKPGSAGTAGTAPIPARGRLDLFGFIPWELIHNLGVAVLAAVGLLVISTFRLVLHLSRTFAPAGDETDAPAGPGGVAGRVVAAIRDVLDEMVRQRRFRTCEIDADRPAYLRSWFLHYCIMWGFVGLGLATAFDFLFKTPGELVPLWYPSRLLGTVAGLALMYGISVTIVRRLRGIERAQSRLLSPDWLFLNLLFLVGLTGLVLETAVYVPILTGARRQWPPFEHVTPRSTPMASRFHGTACCHRRRRIPALSGLLP